MALNRSWNQLGPRSVQNLNSLQDDYCEHSNTVSHEDFNWWERNMYDFSYSHDIEDLDSKQRTCFLNSSMLIYDRKIEKACTFACQILCNDFTF